MKTWCSTTSIRSMFASLSYRRLGSWSLDPGGLEPGVWALQEASTKIKKRAQASKNNMNKVWNTYENDAEVQNRNISIFVEHFSAYFHMSGPVTWALAPNFVWSVILLLHYFHMFVRTSFSTTCIQSIFARLLYRRLGSWCLYPGGLEPAVWGLAGGQKENQQISSNMWKSYE